MPVSKTSIGFAVALLAGSAQFTAKAVAATAAAPASVQGVRLAKLCSACGVVNETHVERRKGKGSGLGAVGGAVAGGVVGNKIGDGSTLGTAGGAVAGGLLGNAIEKQVRRHNVWVTTVTMKDGSKRRFEALADPAWKAGAVVEVGADNQLKKP